MADGRRLAQLARICLGFPEASREDHRTPASFLVRKKPFAYFLDDHHGDTIARESYCLVAPKRLAALVSPRT